MKKQRQFCTFHLDQLFFGIDVLNVQEIILPQQMTAVPLAPEVISGLINLRGQVVTAINLGRWLGIEQKIDNDMRMNVVICTEDEVVSFLVDSIGDVVEPDEDAFEMPPQTLSEDIRDLINGVYKLDNKLLLVMDVDRTIEAFSDSFNERQDKLAVTE